MAKNNNHARTERKKKILKLKAFCKRVMEKRLIKKQKALKPKGITIVGSAYDYAPGMSYTGYGNYIRKLHKVPTAQRKRRKIARQMQRK